MARRLGFCFAVLISVLLISPMHATADSAGTEFIFSFQPNIDLSTDVDLRLYITGEQDTQGRVEIPGLAFNEDFTVVANVVTTVTLPPEAADVPDNGSAHLGIHITAQDDVTVYGMNRLQYTTDAFLALPLDVLDSEYIAMSYDGLGQFSSFNLSSQIAIIATADNTVVEITPTADAGENVAGESYSVTLDRFDVYQLNNNTEDLTGTHIKSNEPVAVMGGQKCADVPSLSRSPTGGRIGWCDHLIEAITPLSAWGQDFVTIPLATRLNGDIIRIVAAENGTRVLINRDQTVTLNSGELFETVLTDFSEIHASGPIMLAQFSAGHAFDNVVSDPFMMIIPANEQFMDNYTFATPQDGFRVNFVNVVVPTTALDTLILDGSPVDPLLFSVVGLSGYSGAQIPLSAGSHTMTADQPFGIYVYGFDDCDSYGYPGGLALAELNPLNDGFAPSIGPLQHIGRTLLGTATDSEDLNANGILDPGEDFNGNGILDRRTEDTNGNRQLDAGEDVNGNGVLDRDRGIYNITLLPDADNLKIEIVDFISGDAPMTHFRLDLIETSLPGTGTLRVDDLNGNTTEIPIVLPETPVMIDVQLTMTVSGDRVLVDDTTFTLAPDNIDIQVEQTVIEWQFDFMTSEQIEEIGFDVIMQDPQPGEQRVITQNLQLSYVSAPGGERIHTELGPQTVVVTATAFEFSAGTNQSNYGPNEDVLLQASVSNVGTAQNTCSVEFVVKDIDGNVVDTIPPIDFAALAPGDTRAVEHTWNTALFFTGAYQAHAVLRDDNGQVINEAVTPFSILPSTTGLPVASVGVIIGEDIGGGTFIEKLTYHTNDIVQVQARITNETENSLINGAQLRITVLGPTGGVISEQNIDLSSGLAPGAMVDLRAYVPLSNAEQGTYQLQATLIDTDTMATVATHNASFNVVRDIAMSVTGTVSAQIRELLLGDVQTCTDTVTSVASEALNGLPIQKTLVVLDTQQEVVVADELIDLAANGTLTQTRQVDTTGGTAGEFACMLRVDTGSGLKTLGYDIFDVYNLIANPGQRQTAYVHETVTLDGGSSREAANLPLNYQWRFVNMPAGSTTTLDDATAASPSFYVDEQGTYNIELIVNNGTEESLPKYVSIFVPNRLPTADAGADQVVSVGDTALLGSGSSIFDPDDDVLTFNWTIRQQPAGSQSALSDMHATNPTLYIDVAGIYLIDLVVNDGFIDSLVDTVLLNVGNVPPVADAGDNMVAMLGDVITLDGSRSSDANGDQVSFRWFFDSVPDGSSTFLVNNGSVRPTFQVDRAGDYVIRLTVNDGLSDSDIDYVTVSVGNSAPIADAGPDQSGVVGNMINLDGTGSSDLNNDELTYRWSMVARPSGSNAVIFDRFTATPRFYLDVQGDFIIQLVVDDGMVTSVSDTVVVTVGNLRPFAVAEFNYVGKLYTGDTVTLDGGNSWDPDGGALTYDWTFIDRPEGSNALLENADTAEPSFTIDQQGDYIAQLVVNDGQAVSTPATVYIEGVETCIQNLDIRTKPGKNQLTWTYNPDTEWVEIERSQSLMGPYVSIGETNSTYATFLDPGLVNGVTYYYRLRGQFAVQNFIECGGYGGMPGVYDCNGELCWYGEGGFGCETQPCEIVEHLDDSLLVQCGDDIGGSTNSCPPEDGYCQWLCECGPECLWEGGEGEWFDFSICEPPASDREECSTQIIAGQPPATRTRIKWVPDLSGMSADQANDALIAAGLRMGEIDYQRTTAVPPGQVIRQDPPRDSVLPMNTTINIVISTHGVTE